MLLARLLLDSLDANWSSGVQVLARFTTAQLFEPLDELLVVPLADAQFVEHAIAVRGTGSRVRLSLSSSREPAGPKSFRATKKMTTATGVANPNTLADLTLT